MSDDQFDRVPPQDIDAEMSVLGSMMLTTDAANVVSEMLRGQDFYQPSHETIFDTIIELIGRAEPADAHHRRAHGPRGEEPASGNRLHTHHPLNNKLDVSRETLQPSVRSAESGTNTRFGRKFLLLFGE